MKRYTLYFIAVFALFSSLLIQKADTQTQDISPPQLIEFSFSPTSIDVSAGSQSVTASFRLTDALSGVSFACVNFRSPSGQQGRGVCVGSGNLISGDAHDGVYQGSIEFQHLNESGIWHII